MMRVRRGDLNCSTARRPALLGAEQIAGLAVDARIAISRDRVGRRIAVDLQIRNAEILRRPHEPTALIERHAERAAIEEQVLGTGQ